MPRQSAQIVVGEAVACLPLGTLIAIEAAAARLRKELAIVTEEIARLRGKLGNERFVANASPELVEAERGKLAEYGERQIRLDAALARIRGDD